MILKHCILHCEDPDVVGETKPAQFISPWSMLAEDEAQANDLMRFYLTDAVVDVLGQMFLLGRRVGPRTTWWAETDFEMDDHDLAFIGEPRCDWSHEGHPCLRDAHADGPHSYEPEPGVVAFRG